MYKKSIVINPVFVGRDIGSGEVVTLHIDTTGCEGQVDEIYYLEHVQIQINMSHTHRGDLEIYLTSPMGEYCNAAPPLRFGSVPGSPNSLMSLLCLLFFINSNNIVS